MVHDGNCKVSMPGRCKPRRADRSAEFRASRRGCAEPLHPQAGRTALAARPSRALGTAAPPGHAARTGSAPATSAALAQRARSRSSPSITPKAAALETAQGAGPARAAPTDRCALATSAGAARTARCCWRPGRAYVSKTAAAGLHPRPLNAVQESQTSACVLPPRATFSQHPHGARGRGQARGGIRARGGACARARLPSRRVCPTVAAELALRTTPACATPAGSAPPATLARRMEPRPRADSTAPAAACAPTPPHRFASAIPAGPASSASGPLRPF